MSGRSIFLGRLFGVPIYIDWSWFLVLGLASWMLATGYFPGNYPFWDSWLYWLIGIETTMLLFISVLVHEFGHAIMAKLFNIPVQRITLFIFGGVAQLGAESRTALAEFMIAIIGPAASFAIAAVFYLGTRLLPHNEPASALFGYLAMINFMLVVFNLIPGFPLDGGRVLRAIIWGITGNMSRATVLAVRIGQLIAIAFVGMGVIRALDGEYMNGLWLAFVGWFLLQASNAQLQAQAMRDVLSDYRVSQAMSRDYVLAPTHLTLQQLVDEQFLGEGRRTVIVQQNGVVEGMLTVQQVQAVPREKWAATTVRDAIAAEGCCAKVPPDSGLWDALEKMDRNGFNQLLVGHDGRVDGLLTRGDVITFLRTVQALGI